MNSEPRIQANSLAWRELAPQARRMRSAPTEAENRLWQSLRMKSSGLKFRRQHAIGPFIVDFYCVKARLVVEVDGPVHENQQEADDQRQRYLEGLGLRVLRFSNDSVLKETNQVLDAIQRALAS